MTFDREKRLLLGWLALLVPLPLPLTDSLEWPVLFIYAFAVIRFLQKVENGSSGQLPNWLLNVLGLAYLPILAIDLRRALMQDRLITALLHLILFLLVVKLYAIRREKDKWHILIAVFFLFIAAMATSSHVTVGLYLLAAIVGGLYVLARFAQMHVLGGMGQAGLSPAPFHGMRRSWLAVGGLAILILSVPIFAAMPRLRQPFIMGRGAGNLGAATTTGFSDRVDLSLTSEIRTNRTVALRMELSEAAPIIASNFRFKGSTYDFYRNNNWYRQLYRLRDLGPANGKKFVFAEAPTVASATIYLEPLDSQSLILPMQAVALEMDDGRGPPLRLDPGGAVLAGIRRGTTQYRVELGSEVVIAAVQDPDEESGISALDTGGLTPRMAELAQQVMGEGDDDERISRLLTHLLNGYTYTLNFVGRTGENPLEDFLFTYRSGHCEYFASAMVLMLRSQGIPARFVTGFLGAELNNVENYYVVRQQNAHAWVEAYSASSGWQVYDPTPPEGRPMVAEMNFKLWAQQVWDYVAFRWDRYILTYGAEDQESFFRKLKERIQELWLSYNEPAGEEDLASEALPDLTDESSTGAFWSSPKTRWAGLLAILVFTSVLVFFLRSRPLAAEEAYRRLRRGLVAHGFAITQTTPPLRLRQLASRRLPAVNAEITELVDLYIRASFAELPLANSDRQQLRPLLVTILGEARAQDRRSRRQRNVQAGIARAGNARAGNARAGNARAGNVQAGTD